MDRQLIEYLPEYLREYREMKIICNVEQGMFRDLWDALDRVWNNQFIESLDEEGCRRWEKILKIQNKSNYSIADRRSKISGRVTEQRPYTMRSLERMLDVLCGQGNYLLKLEGLHLTIRIGLSSQNMYDDIYKLLKRILPANIVLTYTLLYNRHSLYTKHTYQQLSQYTHRQLREDVKLSE